jgi:hypothetical protein
LLVSNTIKIKTITIIDDKVMIYVTRNFTTDADDFINTLSFQLLSSLNEARHMLQAVPNKQKKKTLDLKLKNS